MRISKEGLLVRDPWTESMDESGGRRGIQVIDGPRSFFYPGPCTIEELTALHACQRRCLFGYNHSWDWCYFTYHGHFLDDTFWVPVGIALCMLACGSTDDVQM